jgi:hypothetical protein
MGTSISIRGLSRGVDDAVKLAPQRQKAQFSPELLIASGDIIGRQLSRANVSLHQAEQIAQEKWRNVWKIKPCQAVHLRRRRSSHLSSLDKLE